MEINKVFLGSSSEGRDVAERLAMRLERRGSIETKVWVQGVFDPGSHVLDSLIHQAATTDFAIFVLTADDTVASRNEEEQAPRDNVIFELGLFIGALGKDRAYMVQPSTIKLKLPSDLAGITQLRYNSARSDDDLNSALGFVAIEISDQIARRGKKEVRPSDPLLLVPPIPPEIDRTLRILESNLTPQGWKFRWNPAHSTLRVTSPRGHRSTLKMISEPGMSQELGRFLREIRGNGGRIDSDLLG